MKVFSGIQDMFAATKLKLRHQVEWGVRYGFIQCYIYKMLRSDTNKQHTRVAYRSFAFTFVNTALFLMVLGGLIALDIVVKDRLYEYTLGDGQFSIKSLQKTLPRWLYDAAWIQTNLGGGLELFAYMFYCLFFFPRSRFFYAMAVCAITGAIGL